MRSLLELSRPCNERVAYLRSPNRARTTDLSLRPRFRACMCCYVVGLGLVDIDTFLVDLWLQPKGIGSASRL